MNNINKLFKSATIRTKINVCQIYLQDAILSNMITTNGIFFHNKISLATKKYTLYLCQPTLSYITRLLHLETLKEGISDCYYSKSHRLILNKIIQLERWTVLFSYLRHYHNIISSLSP